MTELRDNTSIFGVRKMTPLVFALDQEWDQCKVWVERLKDKIWGFKVGGILFTEKGPSLIEELKSKSTRVFLDLKYHDIPRTVQNSVRQAFRLGADWVTVHAAGGRAMLEAAAQEQTATHSVFAVSLLTSLDQDSLRELGFPSDQKTYVERLSHLAVQSGIKGLVCSVHELRDLRKAFPDQLFLTPGVRLKPTRDDQKRTGTLREAFENGASYVVLGRALYESEDWEKTWEEIQLSMAEIL